MSLPLSLLPAQVSRLVLSVAFYVLDVLPHCYLLHYATFAIPGMQGPTTEPNIQPAAAAPHLAGGDPGAAAEAPCRV